jgi:hypothetical protein
MRARKEKRLRDEIGRGNLYLDRCIAYFEEVCH